MPIVDVIFWHSFVSASLPFVNFTVDNPWPFIFTFWPSSKWYALKKKQQQTRRKFANLMRLVPIDTRFSHSDVSRDLFGVLSFKIVDRPSVFGLQNFDVPLLLSVIYKPVLQRNKSRSAHTHKWHSARRSDRAQDIPQTNACHQIAKCIDKNSFCSLNLASNGKKARTHNSAESIAMIRKGSMKSRRASIHMVDEWKKCEKQSPQKKEWDR